MIAKIKEEYNSYSKNTKIALGILIALVIGLGIFAMQILFWGLGYTDLNNNFAFGAWIVGDLGLVALGGGAFFTGFILYIFRVDKLEPIINSTVLIGFMCYLFTFVLLLFDLGQPLRAWFGFAYPNWGDGLMPTSMLTEVFFCLSLYFCILIVELIPIALKHKVLDKIPLLNMCGHYLHKIMWIFAAAGTFLSCFHQGSLGGGMWGVLYAKAVWFRPHFFILAIVAATAGGTSFMTLVPYVAGKIMKKEIIPAATFQTLARISGVMFLAYGIFRFVDVYAMNTHFASYLGGRNYLDLWGGYYGVWMLALEFIGILLAILLLNALHLKNFREKEKILVFGISSGVFAIIMSKLSVVLHGYSAPNFPWKGFTAYMPTFQEWVILLGCFSCMVLIYMWCAKYLPLFPHLEEQEHGDDKH
ncbi:MAG: polysulfide reductase NrfD [bacterium]|nr:polysulfide reductase NrfD [bacterium]